MKILTLRFTFILLTALLLTSQLAFARQGSVLERIHEADQPFDNMQIESAHQLSVKTVLSKESYQGGAFRVLTRKDDIGRYRCSVCLRSMT